MNRGSCCTPKFSLPFFTQNMFLEILNCSRSTKNWPDNSPPKAMNPQLGFQFFIKMVELQRILNLLHYPNMSWRSSMPNFMPWTTSLLIQLLKCLEINYTRSKVNCDPNTVKLQDFWLTSIFWSNIHHLIKVWSWFLKKCS